MLTEEVGQACCHGDVRICVCVVHAHLCVYVCVCVCVCVGGGSLTGTVVYQSITKFKAIRMKYGPPNSNLNSSQKW